MFRLQNNVPDVYVEESRDFQLFCRIYDCINGSTRYSIDSMLRISDTSSCDERLLQLLQSKLGFRSNLEVTTDELRVILQIFPHVIRWKGSRTGLEQVVNAYARLNGVSSTKCGVIVDNTNYEIEISFPQKLSNDALLRVLLDYIMPTGYVYNYVVAQSFYDTKKLGYSDLVLSRLTKSSVADISDSSLTEYTLLYNEDGNRNNISSIETSLNNQQPVTDSSVGVAVVANMYKADKDFSEVTEHD